MIHRHSHTSMNNYDNSNERVHQKETLMKWHTHTTHTHTHTHTSGTHTTHTGAHNTQAQAHTHTLQPDTVASPHSPTETYESWFVFLPPSGPYLQRAFIVSAASIHCQRSEHSLSEPTLAPPSPVIAKMQWCVYICVWGRAIRHGTASISHNERLIWMSHTNETYHIWISHVEMRHACFTSHK